MADEITGADIMHAAAQKSDQRVRRMYEQFGRQLALRANALGYHNLHRFFQEVLDPIAEGKKAAQDTPLPSASGSEIASEGDAGAEPQGMEWTPAAAAYAAECGIDKERLLEFLGGVGSGVGGRVTKGDVEAFVELDLS
jgi:pyruvate/2-oxoglutarate dehydrogenase complex dihydrolipoamide acyltransferase (E2) component